MAIPKWPWWLRDLQVYMRGLSVRCDGESKVALASTGFAGLYVGTECALLWQLQSGLDEYGIAGLYARTERAL